MPHDDKFAVLRAARRVWAVGSIHSETERLEGLHAALWPRLAEGDRIVYLGNMIGRRPGLVATVDCLLTFRRAFLARPRSFAADIVYLRGAQEEMWHKLLQLQFATAPLDVLGWMVDQGVGPTLEAYGGTVAEACHEANVGTMALTKWTARMREAMQRRRGHTQFFSALRRAAFTDDGALLLVSTGIDPSRPLEAQSDSFWWSSAGFQRLAEPYAGFRRVIRGFAPRHPGIELGDYGATLDAGCGLGGPLVAGCFDPAGELVDSLSI